MTIPAGARTLGTPKVVVQRLVIVGHLRGNLEQGEELRSAVLKWVACWQQPMTRPEAAALTGLAPAQLRGLIEHQMIKCLRSERGAKGTWRSPPAAWLARYGQR